MHRVNTVVSCADICQSFNFKLSLVDANQRIAVKISLTLYNLSPNSDKNEIYLYIIITCAQTFK